MIKTTSGIIASTPELAAIGEQYVQQVIAEGRRRQAIRDAAVAGSTEIMTPESDFPSWGPAMGQWGIWNISDRD